MLREINDTGYSGPLELELIGPMGDRAGYELVIRRGVGAASVMLADAGMQLKTWIERTLNPILRTLLAGRA